MSHLDYRSVNKPQLQLLQEVFLLLHPNPLVMMAQVDQFSTKGLNVWVQIPETVQTFYSEKIY